MQRYREKQLEPPGDEDEDEEEEEEEETQQEMEKTDAKGLLCTARVDIQNCSRNKWIISS